jgi:hypothetical protein
VSTALAASSPWYCVALRRVSEWLAETARRLEAPPLDAANPPRRDALALDILHHRERAEERLSEIRLRNGRYY